MRPVFDSTNLSRLTTLTNILRWRAEHEPLREAYTFLLDGETKQVQMTYADLDHQARRIAALLQDRVAPGERVLLLYQPGLEYVAAVFGCFYAGIVAVPAYTPRLDRSLRRVQSIFQDARASAALTTSTILSSLRHTEALDPWGRIGASPIRMQDVQWIATDTMAQEASIGEGQRAVGVGLRHVGTSLASALPLQPSALRESRIDPEALALLQYTSGSTGSPKGVMLTHNNLMQNAALLQEGFSLTSQDCGVSWLPPYHDMGLMLGILQALYTGYPAVLMTPAAFVQQPLRWLQAISSFHATISGGPNFAFDLCVKYATPEAIAALDLSSWTLAFNGAEPVRAETLQRFAETFAPCGFRPEAFYPCYGMAETTLFVSGGSRDEKSSIRAFDGAAIENGYAVEVTGYRETGRLLVGCGHIRQGQEVAIVDPQTHESCAPGTIGEIWVRGSNVALGYWGKAEETAETFQAFLRRDVGTAACPWPPSRLSDEGPFLRTGDLGFCVDNELFIAGRLKDLIIIRGRNIYPQDIEQVVEKSHPLLRQGCCAAFAIEGPDTEQLVIVQEVVRQWDDNDVRGKEAVQAMCQAVLSEFNVEVAAIELLRAGTISKTTSGKIQRHACRNRFLAGELDAVYRFRRTHSSQPSGANASAPTKLQETVDWLVKQIAERAHMDAHAVDIHAPLVTFGLNSLEAIGLSNELEQWLGRSLSPTLFYEYPSIDALARSLEGAGEGTIGAERSQGISRPPLPTFTAQLLREKAKANESRELEGWVQDPPFVSPLSHNQKALWFHSRLAPASTAYNLLYAVRIRFCLDVAALQRALEVLASRYPILTSAYALQNGEPVQQMRGNQPLLQEIDATSCSLDDLKVLLEGESNRPIDLIEGPVFRLQLYRRADDDYILGFILHHIVADFWALNILIEEMRYLYLIEKASLDSPLGLAPDRWPHKPSLQHTDYVRWQQSMLQGEEGEYHWLYWQNALAGDLPVLHLPTDRPRPAVQTYNGASHHFPLSTDLERKLRTLANETQVTLFTLMLTAYQVLLHRYSHQDDILVGIPAIGRTHSELEHVIGYLTNTIVVRASFGHHPTFKELLHRTEREVLSALEHQDFPFSLLVERLQPVRDPCTSPIYQTLFVWNRPPTYNTTPVLSLSPFAHGQQGAIVDLSLMIFETEGGVSADFLYNVDLFDASTISRMEEHFLTLLNSIVNAPDQHVRELPFLPDNVCQTLLTEWNATYCECPQNQCIHQLFEQEVRHTPDAVALVFEEQTLTYAELNRRANQLAHHLQTLGVGPELVVGICLPRSLQMIVGILGILKAGGAYLPLDPIYPPDRLAFMLEHAHVPVLITEYHLRTCIPSESVSLVLVDADATSLAQLCDTNPETSVVSDNLAYVIYTSGSTGRPKGVPITHANLLNLVFWHQPAFNIACSDRATQLASPAFDAMGWEVWPYLAIGASVFILANEEIRTTPSLLCDWLMRHAITITFLPTALAESVLDQQWPSATALRLLLTGAETLHRYPSPRLPFALINNYGPTEATVVATSGLVPPRERETVPPSIGGPVANTQIYILDKHLQPTPIGTPGELYIGGAGLARGYFADAELTAEKFLPHPFVGFEQTRGARHTGYSADPGARLYRTGDLARYRPDGTIEYLGRSDNQIKLRGFRIELGEIEAVLRACPAVQEAVVVLQEESVGTVPCACPGTTHSPYKSIQSLPARKYLVAYVAPVASPLEARTGAESPEAIVQEHLRKHLPDYMVPTSVVFLETLPLNPNGKVDRKALSALDSVGAGLVSALHESTEMIAPQTPLQEQLAVIWADLLHLPQVGIQHNFFKLGGHSLLATRLIARIRTLFQVEVPLRRLFETPTIADMALVIEQIQTEQIEQESEKLVQMFPALEELSEDEMQALFAD